MGVLYYPLTAILGTYCRGLLRDDVAILICLPLYALILFVKREAISKARKSRGIRASRSALDINCLFLFAICSSKSSWYSLPVHIAVPQYPSRFRKPIFRGSFIPVSAPECFLPQSYVTFRAERTVSVQIQYSVIEKWRSYVNMTSFPPTDQCLCSREGGLRQRQKTKYYRWSRSKEDVCIWIAVV